MTASLQPIIVFMQHESTDTPAYLSEYLQMKKLDHVVFKMWTDDSKLLPSNTSEVLHCAPRGDSEPHLWDPLPYRTAGSESFRVCAVCSTGGSMSANDDLPYYPTIFSLLRDCRDTRTPYIGHCLGAQLLAVALGGKVSKASQPECGWVEITPYNMNKWKSLGIKNWFVDEPTSVFFAIHGESFSIPPGCHHIAVGETCFTQAYQVGDQFMMATQFHPEITVEKMILQSRDCHLCPSEEEAENMTPEERERRLPSSVTTKRKLWAQAPAMVEACRRYTDHMYEVWTAGVLENQQLQQQQQV